MTQIITNIPLFYCSQNLKQVAMLVISTQVYQPRLLGSYKLSFFGQTLSILSMFFYVTLGTGFSLKRQWNLQLEDKISQKHTIIIPTELSAVDNIILAWVQMFHSVAVYGPTIFMGFPIEGYCGTHFDDINYLDLYTCIL